MCTYIHTQIFFPFVVLFSLQYKLSIWIGVWNEPNEKLVVTLYESSFRHKGTLNSNANKITSGLVLHRKKGKDLYNKAFFF